MIYRLNCHWPVWSFLVGVLIAAPGVAAPIELLVNGEFDQPTVSGTHLTTDDSNVPGWSTDATDGQIEVWSQGAHSSPVNGYDGQPTGQHIELTASQANVWNWQTTLVPNTARADLNFDWWPRYGSNNVSWEVVGSQSGMLASGTASSASGWGRVTANTLQVIPGEEVTVRLKSNDAAHVDQVSLGAYRDVPTGGEGPIFLINEQFDGALPAGSAASPRWFDNDSSPSSFEWFNTSGAGARSVSTTYDHDNDPATPQVNWRGAIEVNHDAGPMTLTAEVLVPTTLDPSVTPELSFFAAFRGALTGDTPTVRVFNTTDSTEVLAATAIDFNSITSEWMFNEFLVPISADDLGDTLWVEFYGGGSNGANGLEMTDLVFAGVAAPEPGTLVLAACGLVGLLFAARRRAARKS